MKSKAVSLLMLAVLSLLLLPGVASATTPSFTDIQNHWAKSDILDFASKGFIEGYPDKTFRPDQPISRAEFTCILLNSLGITPSASSTVQTFSDTAKHWAHAQIAEAVQKGFLVVSEYPNGFKPDRSILRSEAAAMMIRALGKSPDTTATTFKDQDQIAKSMYHGYIKAASDAGLMNGYQDGTFRPFQSVTRAEACVMLSKMMGKTGASTGATTASTPAATSSSSGLTSLVVQGASYSLGSTTIYLRRNQANVPITSISLAGGLIYINNSFPFALNGASNNPVLVVNNIRYTDCQLSVSGSDLQATPTTMYLDSITYNGHQYDADYVNLYVGDKNSSLYLSDAQLVDSHTVKIAGVSYDLNLTKISIALGTTYYAIQGINFGSGSLSLVATTPVVANNLDLSDISAIIVDSQPLNLNTINTLFFLINGARFNISDVVVDASGDFTANSVNYTPAQVMMSVNGVFYQLQSVSYSNSKLLIYCTASNVATWARINDQYQDASTVQIIQGSNSYSLDSIVVVKRNVVRIAGRQYTISDGSLTCRINGTLYGIEDIDYDTSLDMAILDTDEAISGQTLSSQPTNYVFYLNNSLYYNGDSNVTIYAGGTWATFSSVTFPDSSHFTYNSTTYSLVGAQVKINGAQFAISDTAWRVSSEVLEVYLQST